MKNTLKVLAVFLTVGLLTTSCVEKSKKYQLLLAEKEAALVENQNIENEYNKALGIIADVENNLQALREAENLLLMNNENLSQREKLNAELMQIKDAMAANNAKLDALYAELENSNRTNKELRATVKKLKSQLEEKTQVVETLQVQLNEKDSQIAGLNTKVEILNADIEKVTADNDAKSQTIANQILEMNKVYYVGASKQNLKESGILTSKYILRQEVPAEAFTMADKRELKEIAFDGKKIKVLSAHPTESYTITNTDNQVIITVTNPEMFWSVTKYLVAITK
ncbi:MAG: hypothetical protein IKU01_09070 [Bacteroidales bacterium]|nr:hypothetical protein [Bacteroidales bacterium]